MSRKICTFTARPASIVWAAALAAIAVAIPQVVQAQSVWNGTVGGNWSDDTAAGWNGTGVPNSPGVSATITPTATAAFNLLVDGPAVTTYTLGSLTTGDLGGVFGINITATGTSNRIAFDNAGSSAVLTQVAQSKGDTLNVPVDLLSNLRLINHSVNPFSFAQPITGSRSVTVEAAANGGIFRNNAAHTYSGGLTIKPGAAIRLNSVTTFSGGLVQSGPAGRGVITIEGGTIFGGQDVGNPVVINGDFNINSPLTIVDNTRVGFANTIDTGGVTRTVTLGRGNTAANAATGPQASFRFSTITGGPSNPTLNNGTLRFVANPTLPAGQYTGLSFNGQSRFLNNAGLTIGAGVITSLGTGNPFGTTQDQQPTVTVEAGGYFAMSDGPNTRGPQVSTLNGSGVVTNLDSDGGATATLTIVPAADKVGTFAGTINNGDANNITLGTTVPATAAVAVTKSGLGLQIFTGSNTYTGTTTINGGGTLRAVDGVGLPAGSLLTLSQGVFETSGNFTRVGGTSPGQVTFGTSAAGFSAHGGDATIAIGGLASPTPLTWGTAPFGVSTLILQAVTADSRLEFTNSIDMNNLNSRTVEVRASTAVMSGLLTNSNATPGGFNKAGAGTLRLTNDANSFAGPMNVQAGTLEVTSLADAGVPSSVGASPSNGAGSLTLGSLGVAATLRYLGGGHSTDRLFAVNTGGATVDASGTGPISFTNTVGGIAWPNTDIARTLTLTGTNTDTNELGPVINDAGTAAISVVKSGVGTWALLGNNGYTGTTDVAGGTLLVNGNNSGAGAVVVASGATLGGTGSLGGTVTIQPGGTLAPGASIESLGVGGATIAGTLAIEIDDADVNVNDLLNVTGALDISAAAMSFSITGSLTQPAYVFASYGSLVGSEFASVSGLPSGYEIDYNYSLLNQIALVQVSTPFVEGDADGDGDVDFDDLGILLGNYDLTGFVAFTNGDSDGDGDVDFDDLGLLLGNYGFGVIPASIDAAPAVAPAVPEPTAAGILVPAAAMLMARRRRA